ncbi:MAG TPA: rod shape-determining protein MreC [Candidatus Brocadiia bacterium]|nr:rod shape-determining protein MreC [Candidatus Brocadiia bacterium]
MKASRRWGATRLFLALLAAAVLLMILPAPIVGPVRRWLGVPAGFAQSVLTRCVGSAADAARRIGALWREAGEAQRLRQELLRARAESEMLRAEAVSLRRKMAGLEALPPAEDIPRLVADVSGGDASPWRESLALGAGARQGVEVNMAVTWGGAVVGRVVSVGPFSCRALLISDPAFRAAARGVDSGVRGVLAGAGGGKAKMIFVPHDARIQPGEKIVTAGADGVFPPNFLLAVCERQAATSGEMTLNVEARPALNGRDLDSVEILLWRVPAPPPPVPAALGRRP